jgi:hypothetical protein
MKQALTSYLIEQLKPIRATTTIKNWKKINYNNPLFSVKYDVNDYYLKILKKDSLQKYNNLSFEFRRNFSQITQLTYYQTPIINITDLLFNKFSIYNQARIDGLIDYDKKCINDDDNEATFDSLGTMPSRWIKMMADFSGISFKLDNNSSILKNEFESRIEDKIKSIKDDDLMRNIIIHSLQKQQYFIKVENNEFESKIEDKIKSIKDGKYDDIDNWYTRDRGHYSFSEQDKCLSLSAKKVFEDAKNCYSLYPELMDKKKSRYYSLPSSEGGIDMRYFREFAHFKLMNTMPFMAKNYTDVCGISSYQSDCKDVPFEEIIILGELLKRNDIKFKDSLNNIFIN